MKSVFDKANRLHKRARFFFLGSVDSEGFPNIKAVLPAKERDSMREIYFSTNTSSNRVKQYRDNSKACVYFFSPWLYRGVMLKGQMEISEMLEIKKRFWRRGHKKYYTKGVNDPDYCILKFTPESGRYYFYYKSTDFKIQEFKNK